MEDRKLRNQKQDSDDQHGRHRPLRLDGEEPLRQGWSTLHHGGGEEQRRARASRLSADIQPDVRPVAAQEQEDVPRPCGVDAVIPPDGSQALRAAHRRLRPLLHDQQHDGDAVHHTRHQAWTGSRHRPAPHPTAGPTRCPHER